MRKSIAVLGAIGVLASLAGPAAADHEGIHPTFREERVYFHCVGANKVQNLDLPAPWDTTAPAQSVQAGAGCGALDPGLLINEESTTGMNFDVPFSGTSTGNLKNMTVEMWLLGQTNYSAINGTLSIAATLTVDGDTLLDEAEVADIPVQASETGASQKLEFSIINLGSAQEIKDADGNVIDVTTTGFATEDGDGETVREIDLVFSLWYIDEVGAVVWDTTEVPAGITFNDPTPAPTRVSV